MSKRTRKTKEEKAVEEKVEEVEEKVKVVKKASKKKAEESPALDKEEHKASHGALVLRHAGTCSTYDSNAKKVAKALTEEGFEVRVEKGKRNEFELLLADDDKAEPLWSGLALGPPRTLKWDLPGIVAAAQKAKK